MVSAESAKVLTIRIQRRSLGPNRSLTEQVRPVCPAVGSAQCAEVLQGAAAIPKERVLGAAFGQVRGSGHPARIVQLQGKARIPTQRAEVSDGVAWRGLCYGKRGEQAARANRSQDGFHRFIPLFRIGAECETRGSRKATAVTSSSRPPANPRPAALSPS